MYNRQKIKKTSGMILLRRANMKDTIKKALVIIDSPFLYVFRIINLYTKLYIIRIKQIIKL